MFAQRPTWRFSLLSVSNTEYTYIHGGRRKSYLKQSDTILVKKSLKEISIMVVIETILNKFK